MQRRYVTVDVFTERIFGGNPLAVVLDAQGLSTAQMQSIATEFNYSETTFVLPPRDRAHAARAHLHRPVPKFRSPVIQMSAPRSCWRRRAKATRAVGVRGEGRPGAGPDSCATARSSGPS